MVGLILPKNIRQTIVGVAIAFTSGFLFTINRAIFEALNLNITDVLLLRYFLQTVLLLAIISCPMLLTSQQHQPIADKQHKWWIDDVNEGKSVLKIRALLIFQGVCDGLNHTFQMVSVTLMPLGDSSALIFSAPLSTVILSRIFLKTRLRLYKLCCVFIVMTGIILIVRPSVVFGYLERETEQGVKKPTETTILKEPFSNVNQTIFKEYVKYDKYYFYGALAALAASIARGLVNVTTSYLFDSTTTMSAKLIGLYQGFGGIFIAFLFLPFEFNEFINFNVNINLTELVGLHVISIFAIAATLMLNKSIQYLGPTLESFVRSADVIIAYLIQILFFHTVSQYLSFIGASCIIFAIMLIAVEDAIVNRLPMNVIRDIL